jgi:hypothetical protein
MQVRRIANQLWAGLASPGTALLIFIALSLIQITALALPQIPVPASQSTAYSRWLAEFRPRLGAQTGLLASLGLLTVRSSFVMRVMLGFLGLLVAANLDSWREAAQNGAPRSSRTRYGLLILGGLLVIGGWTAQMLWGWQEPGAIAWPGSSIALPQHTITLEQPDGPIGIWRGKVGLYMLSREKHTGLQINATRAGAPMVLLRSVNQSPEEILHLILTPQEPEAFFATEEAALIFRLVRMPDEIQVQAYRSPSGEIVAETVLDGSDDPRILKVGDAQVTLTPVALPSYEIIYNPGAVFEVLGMVFLAAGTVIAIRHSRTEAAPDSPRLDEAEDPGVLQEDHRDA